MRISVYVFPFTSPFEGDTDTTKQTRVCDSNSALVSKTELVPHAPAHVREQSHSPPNGGGPAIPLSACHLPPGHPQPGVDSMEDHGAHFSTRASTVILNSTKLSTRCSYAQKWSSYCRWIQNKTPLPTFCWFVLCFGLIPERFWLITFFFESVSSGLVHLP